MSATLSTRPATDAELAELIAGGATELGAALSVSNIDQLVIYVRLIERWNATYNLTAVRDPRDMVTQHILDCLAAAVALDRRREARTNERILDVGSGAGLPGIVIALTASDRDVTCVDSVGKKAAFITQAAGLLRLKNARAVHARVQTIADRFDVVCSRAFASLAPFVAATGHLLEDAGTWMAMKGKIPAEELAHLPAGLTFHVEPLSVPRLDAQRCVVWIERSKSERTLLKHASNGAT